MICKYCGAEYAGNKCPSCGKAIPLVKRSTELDVLMDGDVVSLEPTFHKAPPTSPTPASVKTFEQGIREGYQKGLKEGYDNGYKEGRTSPPVTSQPKIKRTALLCAVIFLALGTISGIISNNLGYTNGYKKGEDAGLVTGKEQGILIAQSTYEPQISSLQSSHQSAIDQAKEEKYNESYTNGYMAAKNDNASSTDMPTSTPEQTPPSPETIFLGDLNFPYSRAHNGEEFNAIVEKIQVRLKELNYKVGKVDGFFGPNTEEAVKQFQRKEVLIPTGEIDSETYHRLFPEEALPTTGKNGSPTQSLGSEGAIQE